MKIVSWNINGIRSNILCKGSIGKCNKTITELNSDCNLKQLIVNYNPDIICFQETRCNEEIASKFQFPEYPYKYWNSSQGEGARSGNRYSGTSIWSKIKPNSHTNIFASKGGLENIDSEGRFMKLSFDSFDLINVYTPNSGTNYEFRIKIWDEEVKKLLADTSDTSDTCTIYTGDLNVVSQPIDIWNPKYLKEARMPGCLTDERKNLSEYLDDLNYKDVFRALNQTAPKYSWWNMRTKSRLVNKGWRVDYFLVNNPYLEKCTSCDILTEIEGSDHCPIYLDIDLY